MRGINKIILVGYTGEAPSVHTFDDGSQSVEFSLATKDSWRNKTTGEQETITDWHRIKVKGKLAEFAGKYIQKGAPLYVEGKMKYRSFGEEGQRKTIAEVIVQGFDGKIELLPSGQSTPSPIESDNPLDFDDE
ncbi:single-stranded DNA-binding protein [Vibrio algivorus]|uniref:Single-stranded DNA-binding protein n=1 Tax=Vibrio algivorus TaxID=1667024 RepID=A0A557PGW7_9VIBR|nr:single-stranded DNA-binding protein [Vibrio algivorus]TVO39899.1 single-stranded DNA-binding protein [Vibrio algivorus]